MNKKQHIPRFVGEYVGINVVFLLSPTSISEGILVGVEDSIEDGLSDGASVTD